MLAVIVALPRGRFGRSDSSAVRRGFAQMSEGSRCREGERVAVGLRVVNMCAMRECVHVTHGNADIWAGLTGFVLGGWMRGPDG
jgi:hypothetical protein